jgi:glutamate racemase
VVVACNTASAAALHALRRRFSLPIVGMEPAVKPAAAQTRTGHVGVIATPVTFQGDLFASLLERFAHGVSVHTQVCPGLVELVEAGIVQGPEVRRALRACLQPLIELGVDTLVLGCTHYPFLREAIARVAGPDVAIIDPAPAVARQTVRVLDATVPSWTDAPAKTSAGHRGTYVLYTSGETAHLARVATQLLPRPVPVRAARWGRDGRLRAMDRIAG